MAVKRKKIILNNKRTVTPDLGGTGSAPSFAKAVIKNPANA
jgi:hypothetical protein